MEANGNIHEIFFTVKESQYSKIFHEFDSEISSLKKNFFFAHKFPAGKKFFSCPETSVPEKNYSICK